MESKVISRLRRGLTFLVIALLALALNPGVAQPASADNQTKAYELTGEWINPPATIEPGAGTVASQWHLDINDSAAAPGNDDTTGNILVITLENAVFSEIPDNCVTENGQSYLSADKRVLTCDLGHRIEGTAEITVVGILADGPSGSEVKASATFRGLSAELPPIPIKRDFAMHANFNGGSPYPYHIHPGGGSNPARVGVDFPFSVTHLKHTAAGPSELVYDLEVKFAGNSGEEDVSAEGCFPIERTHPGYPYSGGGHDANQTTRFPDCTLEKIEPKKFRLTLRNLDYTTGPALDSNGQPLAVADSVIAAGEIRFYSANRTGKIQLKAEPVTYTSVLGDTHLDDVPANHKNQVPVVQGSITGGWLFGSIAPQPYPGSFWSDTYRAPVGATVMGGAGGDVSRNDDTRLCSVVDTKYLEFKTARVSIQNAEPNLYYDNYPAEIWYYTGELVDFNGNAVDENEFECMQNKVTPDADPRGGWSRTPPADLSKVKAVQTRLDKQLYVDGRVTNRGGIGYLVVESTVKPDVQIGQDIYIWNEHLYEPTGYLHYRMDRGRDKTDAAWQTLTPNHYRYPFVGPGRDVFRVVGSEPLVENTVARPSYYPNEEVDYRIKYGLESGMPNPNTDTVVVTNTLPAGMDYVAGSSSVGEPTITGDVASGLVLKWSFDNVMPNAERGVIDFKATVPAGAQPGQVFDNKVTAESQTVVRKDHAEVTVPTAGHTTLVASTDTPVVDLSATDGAGELSWALTLSSFDPISSTKTDVINVLPVNGDAQGTKLTGDLVLKKVQAPAGATVYYTDRPVSQLNEDPGATVNGRPGAPSPIWSTTFNPRATAIRIVAGELAPAAKQVTKVTMGVTGLTEPGTVVPKAVGRAEHTRLRMRTSVPISLTPPTPEIQVDKNFVSRLENTDQVRLAVGTVNDLAQPTVQVETTGTTTGVQDQRIGATPAEFGGTYYISETLTGRADAKLSDYRSSVGCQIDHGVQTLEVLLEPVTAVNSDPSNQLSVDKTRMYKLTIPDNLKGRSNIVVDCGFVNEANPASDLTLIKEVKTVADGLVPTATPDEFTLRAQDASGAFAAGANGVTLNATPGFTNTAPQDEYLVSDRLTATELEPGAYTLSETIPADKPHYVAEGDWFCTDDDTDNEVPVTGDTVQLAPDSRVTCRITNTTSALTLLKYFPDGDAGDVTVTVTSPDGSQALSTAGSSTVSQANTIHVKPGETYTLDEHSTIAYLRNGLQVYVGKNSSAPEMDDDSQWRTVNSNDVTVAVGEHAVYRYVNTTPPQLTIPLTGGMSRDMILFSGAIILAISGVTLGAGVWRKNTATE